MAQRSTRSSFFPDTPAQRLLSPLREFLAWESAGGVLLMACAAAGLVWANWPGSHAYEHFWHLPVTVTAGGFTLSNSLLHWINDLLMAVFFFVVGLEIKRELLVGELASLRQAALPVVAAIGGMVLPAAAYIAVNPAGPGAGGWGIPMATDIAFAIGILTLLGNRVPLPLKVFLTALAIADDLGAVLVIAVFYTAELSLPALGVAGGLFVFMGLLNVGRVRHPIAYLIPGMGLWLAMYLSGVHATVAGVLAAFTIPAWQATGRVEFLQSAHAALGQMGTPSQDQAAFHDLELSLERARAPMQALEHSLLPWVSLAIMPLFALSNAGVVIQGAAGLRDPVALGIAAGLVMGKPLGIVGAAWLAVKARLAVLPEGVTWTHLWGAGLLGGIGFTMSIFIANLAFGEGALLGVAKLGILGASAVAGVLGFCVLRFLAPPARR